MLFSLFYEISMFFLFVLALPKALYGAVRYGKHKTNFLKRLGFGFPRVEKKGKGPVIWVHAVSVGECHAANPLIKRLKEEMPDSTIVVSSVSETGHQEAKKTITLADYHVYLPFDFYFTARHAVREAQPDLVILCEGDFWYRFLHEAKKQGAVTVVVNGKVSSGSEKNFCRLPFFTKKLFSQIDFLAVQSDLYKERFLHMGIAAAKIAVTGNLKCDSLPKPVTEAEIVELKKKMQLQDDDKVIVIGSTHDPEEEMLLAELVPLLAKFPKLKVIIAPRHPERFDAVAEVLSKHNISFGRWSQDTTGQKPSAYLIDAMGILRKCYQLADIAIVAGSFTNKVGGHNIMEPQAFGIAVISGPYMFSQPQLIESARFYNAILQLESGEIQGAVERLLNQPEERQKLGQNALTMVTAMQGATNRTRDQIYNLIPQFFSCNNKSDRAIM